MHGMDNKMVEETAESEYQAEMKSKMASSRETRHVNSS